MTTAVKLSPRDQQDLSKKARNASTVKIGSAELKFEPDELGEFYLNKAKLELRETPEIVEQALKDLREMLKSETDLIVPLDSDDYLYRFLRPCKWYPESAFELVKRFYGFRRSLPNVCENLSPSREKPIFVSGILTPLPRRCSDGARIFLLETGGRWKPKEISLDEILKGSLLSLDAAMSEPRTQISGLRVIFDMAGLSLTHVTHITPSFAKALVDLVQRCFPCRLKGIHVVNQPFIFNMIFALFKPFLQEKLRKRLHFHGTDRASLLEHFEGRVLPDRYGGKLEIPSEPIGERLWEYFCTFEEDFAESNKYGFRRVES